MDLGADLVAAASERAGAEGLDIEYRVGDAESLPFADGEFDAVISTCGVMFATRPEAAAAELSRVCRRGGRIALTTWLSDSNLFKMFLVMKPYMAPPPTPAPRSPFEWGRTDRIQELLGRDFDLRIREGRFLLSRAERRGRVGNVLDRLWSDKGTHRHSGQLAPCRIEARLHRLSRRLPNRPRHLRAS